MWWILSWRRINVCGGVLSAEYDTWLCLIGNYYNDSTSADFQKLRMTNVCVIDAEKNILFEYSLENSTSANDLKQAINWMCEHDRIGNFGVAITTSKNALLTGVTSLYPLTKIKTRDTHTVSQNKWVSDNIEYHFIHPEWWELFDGNGKNDGYSKIKIQISLRNQYNQGEIKDNKKWKCASADMRVTLVPKWQKSST